MTVAQLIATLQSCDPTLPVDLGVYDEADAVWHGGVVATVCAYDGTVHLFTPGD